MKKQLTLLLVATTAFFIGCSSDGNVLKQDSYLNYEEVVKMDDDTEAIQKMIDNDREIALYQIIDHYITRGNFEKANEILDQTASMDSMVLFRAQVSLTLNTLGEEAFNELKEDFIAKYPQVDLSWDMINQTVYSAILLDFDEYDLAIKELNRMDVESFGDDGKSTVYNNLGLAYTQLGEYEKGLENYQKSLELDPLDDLTITNVANCYYRLGEYEKALENYEKSYKIDSQNVNTLYGYAKTSYYLDNKKLAIKLWTEYTKIASHDPDGYEELLMVARDLYNDVSTEKALVKLVGFYPTYYSYNSELIMFYINNGRIDDAQTIISKYKDASAPYDFAVLQLELSLVTDLYDTKESITNLIEQSDGTYGYYSIMNLLYYHENPLFYGFARDLYDENFGVESRLRTEIEFFYDNDDAYELKNACVALLDIVPNDAYGLEYLADAYYMEKDYPNASINYKKALEANPSNAYCEQSLVDCYILTENLTGAQAIIEKVRAEGMMNHQLYIHSIRVNALLGNDNLVIDQMVEFFEESPYATYIFDDYDYLAPYKNHERVIAALATEE